MPTTAAVLGAGVIGCSWAALFAAAGLPVRVFDPRSNARDDVVAFWENVRPDLARLGLLKFEGTPKFEVFTSAARSVEGADFVQECAPERLALKQSLYAEIEPALRPDAIVATSSSGLLLTDLQQGWKDPARIIIAHPFNPPHLIPLVELFGNDATAVGVLDRAAHFYEHCGKVTIRLRKEVPAHVANRLQAALWREAIHLVREGVVSASDVDLAITAGPGLRWAVMGPHMLLNLGGGPGGLRAYCEQFRDSYHLWW
ncbi:MAG: 3-hydroxyacyl-CoA dehydrogenase family protein, partial [Hyphomicrobiaceae bacterium]